MNKHIISVCIASFLLFLMFLTGCDTPPLSYDNEEASSVTANPHPSDANQDTFFIIAEYHPGGGMGDNHIRTRIDLDDLMLNNTDTDLLSEWPVFVNQYPFEQGGPLFYTGPATFEIFRANLAEFLGLLYNTEDVLGFNIALREYASASYDTGSTIIHSGPIGVSMSITDEFGLLDDFISGNVLDNALIQAAMEYINIENPRISTTTNYNLSGEVRGYLTVITNETEDLLEDILNRSFSYIRLAKSPELDRISFAVRRIDISELYSHAPLIPLEAAMEHVQTMHGVADTNRMHVEIYFSGAAIKGFYIPAYRIYIADEEDSGLFRLVQIPMVAIDIPAPEPIRSASIVINPPIAGFDPDEWAEWAGDFMVSPISWEQDGEGYIASVRLSAFVGFVFNDSFSATINGNPATISYNTGQTVILSYQFMPAGQVSTRAQISLSIDGESIQAGGYIHLVGPGIGHQLVVELSSEDIVNGPFSFSSSNPDAVYICESTGVIEVAWLDETVITVVVPTVDGDITTSFTVLGMIAEQR